LEHKKLGKSGLEVSSIGLGTAFRSGLTEESPEAIRRALDLGITLIDTAEVYRDGRSEELIGKVISDRRDDVVVKTKVARDHLRYEDVLKAAEGSLRRLQVDVIDLYLVHHPNPQVTLKETMRAMEQLVDKGTVRHIGVSNFDAPLINEAQEALSKHEIVANEVKYNLVERDIETEVLPYCKNEKITIIAYSPLARGLLTGRFGEGREIPDGHWRTRDPLFQGRSLENGLELVSKLEEIGEAHGKTPGQVAMSWLAIKPVVVPIFGVSNVRQVEENCGSVGWRISEDELETIERAYKTYRMYMM
jgi:myo-inositol catabolism protein IolS